MSPDEARALRDRLAAGALEKIRADRRAAPPRIARMLDLLETQLFEKELNVDHLMRLAGIRDRSIGSRFRRHVGRAPLAYLVERRVEVARELLRGSELPGWQIADLVGFGSPQVFGRSFKRVEGCSPEQYRSAARRREPARAVVPSDGVITLGSCTTAVGGRSQPHQARRLIEHLWESGFKLWSPPAQGVSPFFDKDLSAPALERVRARGVWKALEGLDFEAQQELVCSDLGFRSPVLFELLRARSRSEGRRDRKRGIELAELALDSLAPLRGVLDAPRLDELAALGWAWLGTARRLALDFPGAEKAFTAANFLLPSTIVDHCARAKIASMECWLRRDQRQYDDIFRISTAALHALNDDDQSRNLGELRLVRALANLEQQKPLDAIPDLLAAIAALEASGDQYFLASAYQSLAVSYVKLGRLKEAEEMLPRALVLAPCLDSPLARLHLSWSEAILAQANKDFGRAEELYRSVRQGLREKREIFDAAIVTLDLAGLYASQDRWHELRELLLHVLDIFNTLRIHREAVATICLLQEAMEEEQVTTAVLHEARSCLERLKDQAQTFSKA